MTRRSLLSLCQAAIVLFVIPAALFAQNKPYDVFPDAAPPYYRVRYEASAQPGELIFPVNYTVWIPENVKTLRGVVVHQHGCGEGSCSSGLTGAFDLHWQALAKQHNCALLAPSYEQPQNADCQMWCDPRNGSDAAFQKGLKDLGVKSDIRDCRQSPGRCGDTVAADTGQAGWRCCIRIVSRQRGFAQACPCWNRIRNARKLRLTSCLRRRLTFH